MTKTWVLLSVVLGIGTIAHEARAQCVLCRCIYSTDPIGIPIRTFRPVSGAGRVRMCIEMYADDTALHVPGRLLSGYQ